ncbi:MAG: hypothetical protein LIQ31_09500 [Planctomycetes bacterium]|nr:hypothetical protein [Planctomycetota bacterium]
MDEQGGGKGVWIGLIAAILVAVVFLVLWFMRGGEVDRLTRELTMAQSGAASAQQRLQSDLDAARNTATTGARRIAELETQLADEQRRASDNAAQIERRLRDEVDAAQASYRAASRELEELRAARAEAESEAIAQLQAQLEDHAYTIESVRADNRLLSQRLDEARESLAQAENAAADTESVESLQAEADRLATELREAQSATDTITSERDQARTELQAVREAAERRQQELTAATERLEAENARLRAEVEGLEETVQQLHGDLDRLEQALDGNETAAAGEDASAAADSASVASLAADQVAELRSRVTTLQEEKDAVTARMEEMKSVLGQEMNAVERERLELAARLEETTARLTREKEELERENESLTSRLDQAMTARRAGEEEAGSLAELRRELTVRQERYAAERNRLQEEIEQLRNELGQNRETIRAMETRLEEEARRAEEREAVSTAAGADAVTDDAPVVSTPLDMEDGRFPSQFVTDDPYRSVGKIVMLEKDGRTYVVNAGAKQNVRPGMRFDVHRTGDDGRSRYIGLVQVVRTLEDFSWVMPVNPGVVMVCPITGRAVLEPGAQFSPFVLTESGSPVPLRSAGDLELKPEMPQAGDAIDNPFFNPDRQSTFALSREVEDVVECALGAVCTLGGLATDGGDSDFLIVSERSIFEGNLVGPKRVTLQHLLKYAAPAPLACRN